MVGSIFPGVPRTILASSTAAGGMGALVGSPGEGSTLIVFLKKIFSVRPSLIQRSLQRFPEILQDCLTSEKAIE